MGRSPRNEQNEQQTPAPQQQPQTPAQTTAQQFGRPAQQTPPQTSHAPANAPSQTQATPAQAQTHTPTSSTPSRALSESEALARDIKEGIMSGFVGGTTVLNGEAEFKGMLRVDGHLTGRVTSEKGTLIVSAGGRVDANISVATAKVNGTVNGDIVATERIEFGRNAQVRGNIQTPALIIEQGAIFEGSCRMSRAGAADAKTQSAAEKSSQGAGVTQRLVEPSQTNGRARVERREVTKTADAQVSARTADAAASVAPTPATPDVTAATSAAN
ncbi:MAG TPA: polymer-forming cytoskeletal protein [Pyrinomonadaceae bacterium]|nr:polymer-forming cytoskeletal protein [Pyrinomonadaceae bacterium]